MLLDFTVQNFKSFRDEEEFSMIPSSDKTHLDHIIGNKKSGVPKALRIAGLYGANGHGKTKFVEALRCLRRMLVRGMDVNDNIPVMPFLLDEKSLLEPTKFSIRFRNNNVNYEYGVVANKSYIFEEWLFAKEKTKEVMVFTRKMVGPEYNEALDLKKSTLCVPMESSDPNLKGYVTYYDFGGTLKKSLPKIASASSEAFLFFVAQGTRANQTFFREAIDRNVSYLTNPFDWFRKKLTIITADAKYKSLHGRAHKDPDFIEFISQFMASSGVGVDQVKLEDLAFDPEGAREQLSDEERKILAEACSEGKVLSINNDDGPSFGLYQDKDGNMRFLKLKTVHFTRNNNPIYFDLENESSGTRRILHLLPLLIDGAQEERVFVVDELDRKLHPIMSYEFIKSFLKGTPENSESQLIFTTHNTHLLDLELLRRDEVWFSEKDKYGGAHLYSLVNLKVRTDVDIERGYLQGRFGAIPFIGNLRDLGWYAHNGEDQKEVEGEDVSNDRDENMKRDWNEVDDKIWASPEKLREK